MPYICPVCSNDSYEEIDGHYICTECQTLSQELIVQEVDDNVTIDVRRAVPVTNADVGGTKRKPKFNLGRPWTLYEAYQFIIQAQAEALIAQGASPELKDVAFTIYSNYLAKMGVVFSTQRKIVPDIVLETKFGREREVCRGTLSNPLNRKKRPLLSKRKGDCPERKVSKTQSNETEPDKYDIVFMENFTTCEDESRKFYSPRKTAANSPEWMNIKKTLAISYIGLIFTNPNFLPIDVVRLVFEGKVPYLSVTHLLPEEMVLSSRDAALFTGGRFDISTFMKEVNRLLAYLKLHSLPTPDMTVLVSRFVRQLHLPEELVSACFALMKRVPYAPILGKARYVHFEIPAVAYIVLALKIAFGLDDSTELKQTKYSEALQDLLTPHGTNLKLFSWGQWHKFMRMKAANEFNAYRELTSDMFRSKLQHVDHLLDCYFKTERDKKRLTTWWTMNQNQMARQCYKPEYRNALKRPLEAALERMGKQTSFTDVADQDKKDWQARGQEFNRCTISHLVSPVSFRRTLSNISTDLPAQDQALWETHSPARTEVCIYTGARDEETLKSSRHQSYLWLLSLLSEMIDCSPLQIEQTVNNLLNYYLYHTDLGFEQKKVCGEKGIYYVSEKVFKMIPFMDS